MAEWNYAELLREHAQEPSAEEVQRVRRQANERVAQRRRPSRWVLLPAGVVLAAAAAGLMLWLNPQPVPSPTPLASQDGWQEATARPGVQLAFQGSGQVATPSEINWQRGELKVEVEPDRGIDFRVYTEEATVRVVGTVFSVDRSSLGTTVSVERGKVEVTCTDEAPVLITADSAHLCLRSPAAALGWATEQERAGGAAGDILRAVERGLALCTSSDPVHDELEVLHIRALARAGKSTEALLEAERRLDRGAALRATEVRTLAARLALDIEGCDAANTHLESLVAQDHGAALVLLADCEAEGDPNRARTLLERALTLHPPEKQALDIQGRLDALDQGGAAE